MSGVDADAARAASEARETLFDTVERVRDDLRKAFLVFLAGLLGTIYALQVYVWDALKAVTRSKMADTTLEQHDIIAVTPFDVILLQAKIGIVVGVVLALPVVVYQGRDALRERGWWPADRVSVPKLVGIGGFAVVLFVVGVAYGFLVFFPFMFGFLADNAVNATIAPRYSIVEWTQFIVLLSISFGLAAQLPLTMTGLSYAGIVPYETFRDKWRHAVVGIFAFGALFSPPDPFTQIMWAAPLIGLYGLSLYLSRIAAGLRRVQGSVTVGDVVRSSPRIVAASAVAGFGVGYWAIDGGLALVGGLVSEPVPGSRIGTDGVAWLGPTAAAAIAGVVAGIGGAVAGVAYLYYRALDDAVGAGRRSREGADRAEAGDAATTGDPTAADVAGGDPAAIDVDELDASGVRAAPAAAFAAMDESEATERARAAIDADEPAKARAILDRFDEVSEAEEASEADGTADPETEDGSAVGSDPDGGAEDDDAASGVGGAVADTASGVFGAVTEEETEEEVGGYLYDLSFVLESLTSKAFRIVGVFMVALAGVFFWLNRGGLGAIRDSFLARLPTEIRPSELTIIALHPAEALVFEVKVATIVAGVVTLPVAAYYAWPSVRDRGWADGSRSTIGVWGVVLVVGTIAGSTFGFAYVAPAAVSYLVEDAVGAGVIVSYRLKQFFWLIFLTTVGVGLLANVPVSMVLLERTGLVSYRGFRDQWREVVVAIVVGAAFLTPGVVQMLVVSVPVAAAYLIGLGLLWVTSLVGRRNGRGGDPSTIGGG